MTDPVARERFWQLNDTLNERDALRAENERLRAVAQAANDAYLAWTKDRSQEDLDSCMTILCGMLDIWDTWREQKVIKSAPQYGSGGAWADLQSETEALDGDQVV